MAHEHPEIQELTNRVRSLERRVKLLISIANYEKYPFIVQCLELDIDDKEIDNMLLVVNKAQHSLHNGTPITFVQFEKELFEAIPSQRGNKELAILILRALHELDKYSILYDHLKKENKNI